MTDTGLATDNDECPSRMLAFSGRKVPKTTSYWIWEKAARVTQQ